MRTLAALLALSIFLTCSPGASAKANGDAALEKIKSLAGDWVGKDEDGQPSTVNYVITSSGTTILETLKPGNHPEMLSVYHMDGEHLMLTHYCSLANQPRMRVEDFAPDSKKIVFNFVDITNLKDKDDGHINGLTLDMPDKDHLTQLWTWVKGPNDASSTTFTFERKKK